MGPPRCRAADRRRPLVVDLRGGQGQTAQAASLTLSSGALELCLLRLFGLGSATSIAMSSARTILLVAGRDAGRSHDGRDRSEDAANLVRVDVELAGRAEVVQL